MDSYADEEITEICNVIDLNCEITDSGNANDRGLMYNEHPTIQVEYKGNILVIDEKIYPMIKKIWDCGIETVACCQGDNRSKAYISFKHLHDFRLFMEKFPEVLNPYFTRKYLTNITYNYLDDYMPYYCDLFTVRFSHHLLL